MNTVKTLIAAVSFIAAGTALAQEAESDAWMQVQSLKTRAEVLAEMARARDICGPCTVRLGYLPGIEKPVAREVVVAELAAARASGEFDRLHAEAWHIDGRIPAPQAVRLALGR